MGGQVRPARVLSHYCPNKQVVSGTRKWLSVFVSKAVALDESSPEKAGVGGSIPSLATMFSISYSHPRPSVCSILFQIQNQAWRNWPQHKMDRTVVYLLRHGSGAASIHLREVSDSDHTRSNALA